MEKTDIELNAVATVGLDLSRSTLSTPAGR